MSPDPTVNGQENNVSGCPPEASEQQQLPDDDDKVENPWAEALKKCSDDQENDGYDSDSEDDDPDLVYQDLELFLKAIDEIQLIEKFRKHKVNLGQLLDFDEQDLINCGVDLVGERKKILTNTGQMHAEKWVPTSLHDLTSKTLLTAPGIYIALNDINKHIEYIGVTFRYLRRCMRTKPQILELGKDYVGIHKIVSELDDMLRTSKTTYALLKELKHQVGGLADKPEYQPPNHIDENYLRNAKLKQFLAPVVLITVALFAGYKLTKFLK